ncbi:FG-GAP repeat domain-containing protein [Streptomyces hydrogenans]|uniref:FG-GAP repeat domain-containing protein n=1 Tax=Streptomyces hydrogenans TaxID=1873719 RepID=UPI0033C1EFA4
MQYRTAGARLASAVTAVLAVTALGAGTLATAPAAFAATSGATAPGAAAAQADALPAFPTGASVTATGPGGFLTYDSYPSDPSHELLWTPYDGGAPTALPRPEGGSWAASGSDVVALGDAGFTSEFRKLTLRNMAEPAAPGVEIDLGALGGNYVAVLGPKSVLAQITDADGGAELHVVTKDGSAAPTTRKVPGLPADATHFFTNAPVRNGIAFVAYETGPAGARKGGRAVIDLQQNKVLETYGATESGYGFSTQLISDTHVAWLDWRSGTGMFITSVDRKTRVVKETVLGSREDSWHTELVGDWLVYGAPDSAVTAVSLTDGTRHAVADSATGSASAADGSMVLTGARGQDGDGLFRIVAPAGGGAPTVTKVADMVLPEPLTIDRADIPASVNLDRTGGEVRLDWTLSRSDAYMFVTLTHVATGREYQQYVHSPTGDENFSLTWDGHFGDLDAPNGAYTVLAEAESLDGVGGRVSRTGQLTLARDPNPHDYTNNGSTDILARDAAGVLWRDDLRDRPLMGQVTTAQRTRIGAGWNTYKQIEAVGSIAGAAHGDLVALDGAGVLWHYLGKGDGTFTARTKVGGGWQNYTRLTGGSDLDADGRSDLLATDAAGALWFYKGTGSATKPFATRVKVGGGWQVYNQLTAVGNIAGTAPGDLVARDKDGVLWLYQGNGRGGFGGRVQIGGGWGAFSHLVGAGDVDNDGRPDLVAHGRNGTYVYKSTGTANRPFTRLTTDLYAGEGSTFGQVV